MLKLLALLLFHSMTTLYFDACSLIYLTKIEAKELLPRLGCDICIGSVVMEEITHEPKKHPEAQVLQTNLKKKIIQVVTQESSALSVPPSLGKGERETLHLSITKGGTIVTDDHLALKYARGRGLDVKTSDTILLELLRNQVITIEVFREKFNHLARIKTLKPAIVQLINQKAEAIAKQISNKKG